MKYNFDEVIDRRGTSSVKWNGGKLLKEWGIAEHFDRDTIALFTADMDFRCPKPIIEAMEKTASYGIYGYSTPEGLSQYYQAIQNWFQKRHGWSIERETIVPCNHATDAIGAAVRAFSKEGEGILITRPVYGPFADAITENGRRIVNSQLINHNGYYTMDFEDIEEKAKRLDVTVFALCSPQNPTGRVWTEKELRRLADICERNHVVLVSDEVHCEIVRKGVKFLTAGKVGKQDNTIVLNAINKTFNCAGLGAAHAIIPDDTLRSKFQENLEGGMQNPFAIAAVIAGYTDGDEWLDQLLEYLDGTIDWVLEYMKEELPEVRIWKPEGTYILWMDFEGTGLSPEEIHHRIYDEANVCLEPGIIYDPECGKYFQRICIPSPRSIVQEAFQRIVRSLKE